jgi:hypothetical protein
VTSRLRPSVRSTPCRFAGAHQLVVRKTCLHFYCNSVSVVLRNGSIFVLIHRRQKHSITPIIRTLVIWIANYPERLGPSGDFVENSTKLICLEITGYLTKYSSAKCYGCLELQIRRGRKVHTQVHTVHSNSPRISHIRQGIPNCQIHIRNYVLCFIFT